LKNHLAWDIYSKSKSVVCEGSLWWNGFVKQVDA